MRFEILGLMLAAFMLLPACSVSPAANEEDSLVEYLADLSEDLALTQNGAAVEWRGRTYFPIDDSGVFFYEKDGAVGCPMPDPGGDLADVLKRHGFHGVIRCRLVDFVDCASESHNLRESGGSRVLELGPDTYRVTRPAGKFSWFSYDLRTRPTPGRPHLVVCQLINDRERYTTVTCNQAKNTVWAEPYAGEEKYVPRNQEGDTWTCDVGSAVYTGREYYCDGKPYTFVVPFYPKTDLAKITVSHRPQEVEFDDINGAAVARIWMFEVIDSLPQAADDPDVKFDDSERKVAIYIPHPWFMYSHYGIPCREKEWRVESLESMVEYLKFCGFNQIQLHIIDGSDRATSAWYDSKLYQQLEGNLFKELLPIAEREGVEVVPIVAPLLSPFNKKPFDAPTEPDEHGWNKDSCLLDKEGEDYTRAFGTPVPNPLRPEVQRWQTDCFREILDRCAKSPAVPAVGFRVNGKIGLCFTGELYNRCGQDGGYSQWMVDEFTKDTGIQVPKQEPTSYQYIKDNCWDEWLQWRCERMRRFWLDCRDFIRTYRSDLCFVAACDLPSETPGYNIEWPSGEFTIRDLFRHHGYDPELFTEDEGIWIQRGMMVASDRYWYMSWFPYEKDAWAHKMFNYAPGVAESYNVPDSSGVEFYHNYWEESPHPDPEYGPDMRTATPVAYKDFFYEPAAFSIRKVNVDRIAFMGWERACAGHEHDMRRFSRAFRAIPKADPRDFDGKIEVISNGPQVPVEDLPVGYKKPEMDVLWSAWYGDKLAIVNDAFCSREVSVTVNKTLGSGQCVYEHGAPRKIDSQSVSGKTSFKLDLAPFDLQVISLEDGGAVSQAGKLGQPSEQPVSLRMSASADRVLPGTETSFGLVLSNNSRATIKDVVLNIRLPKGWAEKSGDARVIQKLAAGSVFEFPVTVSVPMSAVGVVDEIAATVSYMDSRGAQEAAVTVPVHVSHPVQIVQKMPVYTAAAGEALSLRFSLTNHGPQPAAGKLSVVLPARWEYSTQEDITIQSGQTVDAVVEARIPSAAAARRYEGRAVLKSEGIEAIPAPIAVDVAMICPKLSGEVAVDGVPADWSGGGLELGKEFFRIGEGADLSTPDELQPRAWVAWDDDKLYIGARTNDSDFNNVFPENELWKGDSLQIGIDIHRGKPGPRGFFEYGFTAASNGGAKVWRFRSTKTAQSGEVDPEGFAVKAGRMGTTYEAAIKWEDLGFQPRSGDVIGLALVLNDYDGKKRRALTFAGGLADEKEPSEFIAIRME